VVRVALLALRNLLAAPGLELGPELVELGLPKVVQQRLLQARAARSRRGRRARGAAGAQGRGCPGLVARPDAPPAAAAPGV